MQENIVSQMKDIEISMKMEASLIRDGGVGMMQI